MKDDEKYFLIRTINEGLFDFDGNTREESIFPRDMISEKDFPIHYKRATYLLEKWIKKGWYEYGVALDLGWLTEEGIEEIKKILKKEIAYKSLVKAIVLEPNRRDRSGIIYTEEVLEKLAKNIKEIPFIAGDKIIGNAQLRYEKGKGIIAEIEVDKFKELITKVDVSISVK